MKFKLEDFKVGEFIEPVLEHLDIKDINNIKLSVNKYACDFVNNKLQEWLDKSETVYSNNKFGKKMDEHVYCWQCCLTSIEGMVKKAKLVCIEEIK